MEEEIFDINYLYSSRGQVRAEMGNYEEALKDYDKAIELNHSSIPIYYFLRGNVKYNLGQYKDALEDYNKCLELDDSYTEAYEKIEDIKSKLNIQ